MNMTTHYYGNGTMEHVTEDGRFWRQATPAELLTLGMDEWVYIGAPHRAGDYHGFVLAGGFPLLAGLAALFPVYVLTEGRVDHNEQAVG